MKAKFINEGFATEEGRKLDSIASLLGYDDLHEMLGDNPGLYEACIEWIDATFGDQLAEEIDPDQLEELGLWDAAEQSRGRGVNESLNESVHLGDMYREMGTWFDLSPKMIKAADESGIDTKNNENFAQLVDEWRDGMYDEDPYYVMQQLEAIIVWDPQ